LLSLGVETAVRHSASAIGITLSLLYLLAIIDAAVTISDWYRRLELIDQ
jgi:hypothetical protein